VQNKVQNNKNLRAAAKEAQNKLKKQAKDKFDSLVQQQQEPENPAESDESQEEEAISKEPAKSD